MGNSLPWHGQKGNELQFRLPSSVDQLTGENIFYECQICEDEIPSLPKNEVAECKCKNVLVDISSARIGVRDESRVKVFKNI